jgi:hypothetical protein
LNGGVWAQWQVYVGSDEVTAHVYVRSGFEKGESGTLSDAGDAVFARVLANFEEKFKASYLRPPSPF